MSYDGFVALRGHTFSSPFSMLMGHWWRRFGPKFGGGLYPLVVADVVYPIYIVFTRGQFTHEPRAVTVKL